MPGSGCAVAGRKPRRVRTSAPAFSPGTEITPAYPGGRERHIPALPDAGNSAKTGTGESGAVGGPGCTGPEVGESAAERETAALPPVYAHNGTPGGDEADCRKSPPTSGRDTVLCTVRIRGYYRYISKAQLKRHTERFVPERHLRQVIHQYIDYGVEDGGEFYTPPSGIPRGCALSPLLGHLSYGTWTAALSGREGCFMSGIWMTFCFCLSAAGRCAGLFPGCTSTSITQVLSVIRTKPQSVGLRRALTG